MRRMDSARITDMEISIHDKPGFSRQAQLLEQLGRRSLETRERNVAHVIEIFAAGGCRVDPAGREIAIECEEARGVTQRNPRTRLVADVIADSVVRRGVELDKCLAGAAPRRRRPTGGT